MQLTCIMAIKRWLLLLLCRNAFLCLCPQHRVLFTFYCMMHLCICTACSGCGMVAVSLLKSLFCQSEVEHIKLVFGTEAAVGLF